jgi:tetratricopeptide (TPR) repeat protein
MVRLPAIVLAGCLLAATAVIARTTLEPEAAAMGRVRDPTWLPSGRSLRVTSLGQRLLLSDVYWLRLVQYMGETLIAKVDRWGAALPLAEIVTDLDPRHGYAYQVVGSNLGALEGRGPEADRILKKGMAALPDRWTLPWTYAVNKFLYEGDFVEAAKYARKAAEVGHRPHLALLAANLALAADREYDVTEAFLLEAIPGAETPDLRAQLERRLVKVRTYQALSTVERAVAAYRRRYVIWPMGLDVLVHERLLARIPEDPSGGQLRLDLATGEVRSTVLGARKPIRNTLAGETR